MAEKKKRTTMMPSSSTYGGGSPGLAAMGMFVTAHDAVKMLEKTPISLTVRESDFRDELINLGDHEGVLLFESVWQRCREVDKTSSVPRGASFSENQWKNFQGWWLMRQIFDKYDTDNTGTLDMKSVWAHPCEPRSYYAPVCPGQTAC